MLSNSDRRGLEVATRAAENSECRQKHGAVVVKNGNLLAIGINKNRNHPNVLGTFTKKNASYHAEMVAMARVKSDKLKGSTLFVARVMGDGSTSLSKPCRNCQREIDKRGIKRVVYTV